MTKRSYESEALTVEFDGARCIHAEACVDGLPGVFDPQRRPWVDPRQASTEELVEVIERCPTGALQYRRKDIDGDRREAEPPATNSVRPQPAGPLYLKGDLRLELPAGGTLSETRVALCRCGRSGAAPFCDNSHLAADFDDPGLIVESRVRDSEEADAGTLSVSLVPKGPIRTRGPVEIVASDGTFVTGSAASLCRCGHSGSKPFCDGSHARVAFEAE